MRVSRRKHKGSGRSRGGGAACDLTAATYAAWDANADARLLELSSGTDSAYTDLVSLALMHARENVLPQAPILDVGCGLGFLTAAMVGNDFDALGIDPSVKSVELASRTFPLISDHFLALSVEEFEVIAKPQTYDVIFANMVLHNAPNLVSFFRSISRLLSKGGSFWASIPNPDSYLQGRADIDVRNLDLTAAQTIGSVPFRIRGHHPHPVPVTFFHRPFRDYAAIADIYGLHVSDYRVPERVGTGRKGDVSVMVFRRSVEAEGHLYD